jgi:hypothetical protein
MLRHKAFIQAARLAFGISGIQEEDEFERTASIQAPRTVERATLTLDQVMPGKVENHTPVTQAQPRPEAPKPTPVQTAPEKPVAPDQDTDVDLVPVTQTAPPLSPAPAAPEAPRKRGRPAKSTLPPRPVAQTGPQDAAGQGVIELPPDAVIDTKQPYVAPPEKPAPVATAAPAAPPAPPPAPAPAAEPDKRPEQAAPAGEAELMDVKVQLNNVVIMRNSVTNAVILKLNTVSEEVYFANGAIQGEQQRLETAAKDKVTLHLYYIVDQKNWCIVRNWHVEV